jgi:hypothetical protein
LVNRSVTWASWDEELLALKLQELNAEDLDLSLTGFDPTEIDVERHASPRPDATWAKCARTVATMKAAPEWCSRPRVNVGLRNKRVKPGMAEEHVWRQEHFGI